MSAEYGWRFQDYRDAETPSAADIFGIENTSHFTVVRCPVCGYVVWVAEGQFDVLHTCTIICPYSGDQMRPIPGNPGAAVDTYGNPIPLVTNNASNFLEGWKEWFLYCPSPNCSYLAEKGFAYQQRRVEVEILASRG
jgi:hypothetical protein